MTSSAHKDSNYFSYKYNWTKVITVKPPCNVTPYNVDFNTTSFLSPYYTVQQLFAPCIKFMFYDASVCPKYVIDSHLLKTTTLGK